MSQNFSNGLVFGGEVQFDISYLSAFGVPETAEQTPVVQGDFVYGINDQIWSTPQYTGTGALVDVSDGRLRIQCGTSSTSYAYVHSRAPIKYRAGQGCKIRITPIFTSGSVGNIQIWGAGALQNNSPYDGYFFGVNPSDGIFGIAHYNRGSGTWTAQADWNEDKCNGSAGTSFTFNLERGTPAQIVYPYLGYGNVMFFLQNPNTGRMVLCHMIKYANAHELPQLSNPTMYVLGYTANSGNTTNKSMYCGSIGAFISGYRSYIGNPKFSAKNNKSAITTETSILTLKNASMYNGIQNRSLIRLTSISFSSSAANGISTLDLIINPILGGSPSFTPISGYTVDGGDTIISGSSVMSYDTAGTTITGGTRIFGLTRDNPNSGDINLIPYDIFIAPGETMAIAGYSSISSQIGVTINEAEDI